MSKKDDIRRYLSKHRGRWLTPLDALRLFGCMSLSQRVGNLRREGVKIVDRWVRVGKSRVKEYSIPRGRA